MAPVGVGPGSGTRRLCGRHPGNLRTHGEVAVSCRREPASRRLHCRIGMSKGEKQTGTAAR